MHCAPFDRDHYFDGGYFEAGNEPGFETPWLYHYANRPDLSALRVREVVFDNFNTGIGGVSTLHCCIMLLSVALSGTAAVL